MKGLAIRLTACGAVLAVLMTTIALPVSADVTPAVAPRVSVANPSAGDYLRRGADWVTGIACDPNASMSDATAGVAKVSVYLGDRDTAVGVPWYRAGGYFGSADINKTQPDFSDTSTGLNSRLGLRNPSMSVCKNPNAGWRVLTSSLRKGKVDMNVYVLGKNGKETKVTIAGLRIDMP